MSTVIQETATTVDPPLPGSLAANPWLADWLRVDRRGFVEVSSGKVELGQGILTALAQIAADELDLDFSQIRMMPAVTGASPNEAVTSGSQSIQQSGSALRHACAQARTIYLNHAARVTQVDAATLQVVRGEIHSGAHRVSSYWELADPELLQCAARPGIVGKTADRLRVVGQSQQRDDIPPKVFGNYRFIQDLVLPGMLHGRIVRPPSPAAVLREWPIDTLATMDGVLCVARSGSLAGVIAETEAQAELAAEQLGKAAVWQEASTLPDETRLSDWLRQQPTVTTETRVNHKPAMAPAVHTLSADYSKPFIHHASIGTSCALALSANGLLSVWSHSQGIYNLRKDLSLAFNRPESSIVVHHVQGAGCYGHNGADDVAFDAAWLALQSPGHAVRVQWSRSDELRWSPLGPAMSIHLEADIDAGGQVVAWRHTLWSPGHGLRPGRSATPTLLGSWYQESPFPHLESVDAARSAGGGANRNGEPIYAFPQATLLCHKIGDMPLRTSALRALGAYANVFAIESFMDELAATCGRDPLAYRLDQLTDPRAIDVLRTAAQCAGWDETRGAPSEGMGRGIGFARYKGTAAYCAVVAEIEVSHRVRVKKLTIVVDVGLVINPDGVRQQIEGGAIQATSWALLEAARFDGTRVVSDGWERYPILRFQDVPEVDVTILDRPQYASAGAGEASLGPTAAAIGNALFQALGLRVRDLPLTPERIVQAMSD